MILLIGDSSDKYDEKDVILKEGVMYSYARIYRLIVYTKLQAVIACFNIDNCQNNMNIVFMNIIDFY